MENYYLDNDIIVFCVTARSFPQEVLEAHQKLHEIAPFTPDKKFFGISRPENGSIVYKAATEETYAGEAQKNSCETMVIKKGIYMSIDINNYMQDTAAIGNAFSQLITQPGIDPEGYCVEWYLNDKEVRCMVRLAL